MVVIGVHRLRTSDYVYKWKTSCGSTSLDLLYSFRHCPLKLCSGLALVTARFFWAGTSINMWISRSRDKALDIFISYHRKACIVFAKLVRTKYIGFLMSAIVEWHLLDALAATLTRLSFWSVVNAYESQTL